MIEECDGYKRLLSAVEKDEGPNKTCRHDYRGKLKWIIDRANHYADKTGLAAHEILNAWEEKRTYWYMNYYQEANQPEIKGDKVRVFETPDALMESIGKAGFRCPYCNGVSKSPYRCDTGLRVKLLGKSTEGVCNWGVGGLLGSLGKGVYVFVKTELRGEGIFKPVAWETSDELVAV